MNEPHAIDSEEESFSREGNSAREDGEDITNTVTADDHGPDPVDDSHQNRSINNAADQIANSDDKIVRASGMAESRPNRQQDQQRVHPVQDTRKEVASRHEDQLHETMHAAYGEVQRGGEDQLRENTHTAYGEVQHSGEDQPTHAAYGEVQHRGEDQLRETTHRAYGEVQRRWKDQLRETTRTVYGEVQRRCDDQEAYLAHTDHREIEHGCENRLSYPACTYRGDYEHRREDWVADRVNTTRGEYGRRREDQRIYPPNDMHFAHGREDDGIHPQHTGREHFTYGQEHWGIHSQYAARGQFMHGQEHGVIHPQQAVHGQFTHRWADEGFYPPDTAHVAFRQRLEDRGTCSQRVEQREFERWHENQSIHCRNIAPQFEFGRDGDQRNSYSNADRQAKHVQSGYQSRHYVNLARQQREQVQHNGRSNYHPNNFRQHEHMQQDGYVNGTYSSSPAEQQYEQMGCGDWRACSSVGQRHPSVYMKHNCAWNNSHIDQHQRRPTADTSPLRDGRQYVDNHSDRCTQANQEARPRGGDSHHIKVPIFTGKEEWCVWLARFEAIAYRQGWSEDERLDNLLPRIEGEAAQFIFAQLPPFIVHNYQDLIGEMNSRYRVIETPKSFAVKFNKRKQGQEEKVEEYAADLKRLYDRAHGFRDRQTREEDLLRQFLDGLLDEEIKFEVEYHKEPTNIDEAVFYVVSYFQTKGRDEPRSRKDNGTRRATADECTEERQPLTCNRLLKAEEDCKTANNQPEEASLAVVVRELLGRLEQLEARTEERRWSTGTGADKRDGRERQRKPLSAVQCYRCYQMGHYARECQQQGRKLNDEDLKVRQNDSNEEESSHLNFVGPALGAKGRSTEGSEKPDRSGVEVNHRKLCDGVYVEGVVEDVPVLFTADTGASKTVISSRVFDKIAETKKPRLERASGLRGAGGAVIERRGKAQFALGLGPVKIVAEAVVADIEDDALLGYDVLVGGCKGPADILLSENKMILDGVEVSCVHVTGGRKARKVTVANNVIIPGNTETVMSIRVEREEDICGDQLNYTVEPARKFMEACPLLVDSSIMAVDGATYGIRVCNPMEIDVTLKRDAEIGTAEPVGHLVNVTQDAEFAEVNVNNIRRLGVHQPRPPAKGVTDAVNGWMTSKRYGSQAIKGTVAGPILVVPMNRCLGTIVASTETGYSYMCREGCASGQRMGLPAQISEVLEQATSLTRNPGTAISQRGQLGWTYQEQNNNTFRVKDQLGPSDIVSGLPDIALEASTNVSPVDARDGGLRMQETLVEGSNQRDKTYTLVEALNGIAVVMVNAIGRVGRVVWSLGGTFRNGVTRIEHMGRAIKRRSRTGRRVNQPKETS